MLSGWGGPLLASVVLWGLVGVACLPVLVSARIRKPLGGWPTRWLAVNYAMAVGAVVFGHAGVFLAGVIGSGGLEGAAVVRWTLLVAAGYPLALWVLASILGSATGHWSPSGNGTDRDERIDGRFVLGLASVWYAVVVTAAAAFVFFLLFVFYFPG